ncbi:MAG: hypothetical protein ABIK37_01145 [candidate division WOR-3 bacterium]
MKSRLWLSASFLLIAAGPGLANPERVMEARDYCYSQNYKAAAEKMEALIRADDGPTGLFWHACLVQLLLYDSGDPALIDSFYRATDRAVEKCRQSLRKNPDDKWALLYLGMAELNRANCLSWQQRKLPAFRTMLRVPSTLSRAQRLDPGLIDTDFGLGVVEYFKAAADRYLFGLGLIGSRERAYARVRRAQRGSGVLQPMAEFLLGFMMKEDRLYEGAAECCYRLLAKYPGNRSARRLLRDIRLEQGRYRQALEVATGLETDIAKAFPGNRYGIAENRLKMAQAWEKLGQKDSARFRADQIIAWEGYQGSTPWLACYVRDAKRLKARLDN